MNTTHRQQLYQALDHAIQSGRTESLKMMLDVIAGNNPEKQKTCDLLVQGVNNSREAFSELINGLRAICDAVILENERES